jgi:hypothetical protein
MLSESLRQRSRINDRPLLTHGFRAAYGRLSPLTGPRALIGKVCNGSTSPVHQAVSESPFFVHSGQSGRYLLRGVSRRTSVAGLSDRSPMKTVCRKRPSAVQVR